MVNQWTVHFGQGNFERMLQVRVLLVLWTALCLLCGFALVSRAAVWLGTAPNMKLCLAIAFLMASRGGLRRMALLTVSAVYVWTAPVYCAFAASATIYASRVKSMAGTAGSAATPESQWTAAFLKAKTEWIGACDHILQCMVAAQAPGLDGCSKREPDVSCTSHLDSATLSIGPELADEMPTEEPSLQTLVSMAVSSTRPSDHETSFTAAGVDCHELALSPMYDSKNKAVVQERPASNHAAGSNVLADNMATGWKLSVNSQVGLSEADEFEHAGQQDAQQDLRTKDSAEADCLQHDCQPKEGASGCSEQTTDEKLECIEAGQALCHLPACADRGAINKEGATDAAGGSTDSAPSVNARAVPGMPQIKPCWEDLFTDAMSSEALCAEAASASSPTTVESSLQFRIHDTAAGHLLPVAKLTWPAPIIDNVHMDGHSNAAQRVQREEDLIPALHTLRKTSVRKLSWLLNERCKAHRAVVPQPPVALAVTCASASSLRWSRSADGKYTGMACV